MKKYDVLQKGNLKLRILVIKDTCCLVINCDANSMPVWISANELADYTVDPAPAVNTAMTLHQKQLAHERFTLIAPMLAFLTDDKERNRLMDCTAKQHGISKQTLRRYLCRYLVYQDVSALAPAVREAKQELTQDQKNMRWALNKYFYERLILNGTLDRHLADAEERARAMLERLISQMTRQESITEGLKASNQMEWIQRMNSICSREEEIVREEVINTL